MSITKCYISLFFVDASPSALYQNVLDMCSDISRISNPFYLISPAFPAGFRGTGTCMCRIKPVGRTWGRASIQLEHIMLSDRNVCNEALGIFITIGRKQQKVFHECSPTQLRLRQMRYLTQAKGIRVLFRRRMAMNVTAKTVVWIGIRGMSTTFSHKDCMPYQHFPYHWPIVRGVQWSMADSLSAGPGMGDELSWPRNNIWWSNVWVWLGLSARF